MNKKKWFGIFVLGFMFLSLVIVMNYVSAAYTAAGYSGSSGGYGGFGVDIRRGSEQLINFVVDWAEPFLQAFLGGYDYTGYLLFEKFLLFVLLLSLIFLSLKRTAIFDKQRGVLWIVSVVVSLLAVRFMDFAWINTVILSYTVLGVVLAGILPFVVYLFFLHGAFEDYPIARKIGWIFFIVVYYGLWSTATSENFGSVYFWTMAIALVFFLLDGTIHRYLARQRWDDSFNTEVDKQIARIDNDIRTVERSGLPESRKERLMNKLERERERLIKHRK